MGALQTAGASGAGLPLPEWATKDEAPGLAGREGFREQEQEDGPHCAAAAAALRVIEGERRAREFLARQRAELADPDELAQSVAGLYLAELRGFCRVVAKALEGAR